MVMLIESKNMVYAYLEFDKIVSVAISDNKNISSNLIECSLSTVMILLRFCLHSWNGTSNASLYVFTFADSKAFTSQDIP